MSDINPSVASAAQNPPAFARLEAGLTAPDFTLPSDNGGSVTLSALRGQNIILYFYPAAMTPGCTTEACDFRDNLARLSSRGFTVLGVSKDRSGAMHLLVGVGVPVRERYGGRIVDLPHAVAVGDETLGDFSLGGRHLVCCGV